MRTSKKKELINQLNNELSNYNNYLEWSLIAKKCIKYISKLKYNKILLELTPLNEIKFKIQLENNIFCIISKSFTELKEDLIVYNMYTENINILSGMCSLNKLTKIINSVEIK